MNEEFVPILVAVILSTVVVLLALGGLNLALWRDVRADIQLVSRRLDSLSECLARIDERLAAIHERLARIEGHLGATSPPSA